MKRQKEKEGETGKGVGGRQVKEGGKKVDTEGKREEIRLHPLHFYSSSYTVLGRTRGSHASRQREGCKTQP